MKPFLSISIPLFSFIFLSGCGISDQSMGEQTLSPEVVEDELSSEEINQDHLGLRLGFGQTTYLPGEEIELRLYFKNNGTDPIHLFMGDPNRSGQGIITAKNSNGEKIILQPPTYGHGYVVTEKDFHLLDPGEEMMFTQTVLIGAPGQYRLEWSYRNRVEKWEGGQQTLDGLTEPLFDGEKIPYIWKGELRQTITVNVQRESGETEFFQGMEPPNTFFNHPDFENESEQEAFSIVQNLPEVKAFLNRFSNPDDPTFSQHFRPKIEVIQAEEDVLTVCVREVPNDHSTYLMWYEVDLENKKATALTDGYDIVWDCQSIFDSDWEPIWFEETKEQQVLRIAEEKAIESYGKELIENEKPLSATLEEGIWTVDGTVPCSTGDICRGGAVRVKINDATLEILEITHYR